MDLNPRQFARIRVRAMESDGIERIIDKHFSVDPRTITLDRLQHLLARSLDIREDFSMWFLREGKKEQRTALTCDWDLEGALLEESTLHLILQLHPREPGYEEWDIICSADVPLAGHEVFDPTLSQQTRSSVFSQVFQLVPNAPSSLLSESEFRSLEEWPCPLRYAVYRASGADPKIRPSLWMHLLDVYPAEANAHQRKEFLNKKLEEYYKLRYGWQRLVQAGTIPSVLRDIMTLVKKDVRRTDRTQCLEERSLYNILTTFAVNHPSVGYCQGMSDLLSPLLHVMEAESRAYVAFCGLMQRMRDNFRSDGRSVRQKFRHLRHAIRSHDIQLYEHLSWAGGLDLLFCYRWLLLDLKREFQYEEMLRFFEILWASMPPLLPERGVDLYEVRFPSQALCESLKEKTDPKDILNFTDDHFGSPRRKAPTLGALKRWALHCRRMSIAQTIASEDDSSSGEDEKGVTIIYGQYLYRKRARYLCRSWSGQDSTEEAQFLLYANTVHDIQMSNWLSGLELHEKERRRHGSNDSNYSSNCSEEELEGSPALSQSEGYTSDQESETITDRNSDTISENSFEDDSLNSYDSADTYFNERTGRSLLPPPHKLGDGKPFIIFACLTMILNHRDVILSRKMDANEIGIYLDRLTRKHKLSDVLSKTKDLFSEYLNSGWSDEG